MKKILISAGTIAVVAALTVGGTIAFYNDTETSTGNIFTAGSIDLKVDHTLQTYNGVDCQTCDVDLVSDTSNMVVATSAGSDPVAFPHAAVIVAPTSITTSGSNWDANIPGANWIWATDPVLLADVTTDVTYTFEKKFTWNGPFAGASVNFAVASDNSYEVWLNGTKIAEDTSENNHSTADVIGVDLTPHIVPGTNTLQFVVKNWAQPSGTVLSNPAGLKYSLHIDGECGQEFEESVPGFQQACRLWTEKDLGDGDTFFNFGDVKPADWGTNVISLHVSSNDAYACLIVSNKDDKENTLLGPEVADGDSSTVGNPNGMGDLSNYLNVFTWKDTDGNGIYDTGESSIAGPVSLSGVGSIASLDTSSSYLTATTTQNVGLVWCAGTLATPVPGSPFVCNGSGMGNIAQSDSFSASLTAYAEQVRNNSGFTCAGVASLPPYAPVVLQ
ncbi:MAG: TasA family protein [bacterium]|nr:TasA family protein [bacterium]